MEKPAEMASSFEEEGSDESQHSLTSSTKSNSQNKSQKWTKEEDASLKFLVEQHGTYTPARIRDHHAIDTQINLGEFLEFQVKHGIWWRAKWKVALINNANNAGPKW